MINRNIACFFAFILIFCSVSSHAITPEQVNLREKYNPDGHLSFQHRLVDNGSMVDIFLKVNLKREGETLDAYTVILEKLEGYNQDITFADTLNLAGVTLEKNSREHIMKWSLAKSSLPNLLFFVFDHKSLETNYYHDILLDDKYVITPAYLPLQENGGPLFDSWIQQGSSLTLASPDSVNLSATRYPFTFPPADPPMKTDQDEVSPTLQIDTSFSLATGELLNPSAEGLYFFRSPDENEAGIALKVTSSYYPKPRTLDEVIDPLIYISTSLERTELTESLDKKQALDTYLLSVTRTPERGKWLMKNYFRQVAESNTMFTTYKEGWKTDQGMVYILYGTPDAVYSTEKGEEWVYDKSGDLSKIRFTFARVKNPYTNSHFVLLRSKSYERPWFTNVDLWRKARKDL